MTAPTEPPRGARARFAAALAVYGLWVALLGGLALVASEPPDPVAGVNPGADLAGPDEAPGAPGRGR